MISGDTVCGPDRVSIAPTSETRTRVWVLNPVVFPTYFHAYNSAESWLRGAVIEDKKRNKVRKKQKKRSCDAVSQIKSSNPIQNIASIKYLDGLQNV